MADQQEKFFNPSLSYDKDIFLSKKIQMTLLSAQSVKLYENLWNVRSSIFPINEYISKKQEIDLIYQHPEIRSMTNMKVKDEYNNLQMDFINKWYDNFAFQSLCMSPLAEHYYRNALTIPNCLQEEFIEFKHVIKAQYTEILDDNQLQVNSALIKTYTKNFIKSINICLKEALQYSEIISETLSLILSNNYRMIFFFGNEIITIVELIRRLFREHQNRIEEQLMLIQILFNISLGFKSLYGLLVTINLIQSSNLESKNVFDSKSLKKLNKIVYETNNTPLLEINHVSSSFDTVEAEDLTFTKSTATLASNDILLLHNQSFGLLKLIIVHDKDLKFKEISSSNDQATIPNINKTSSLFVYREIFGFLFSYQHFKQDDGDQKLFTLFNTISLKPFKNNSITLSYDDLTQKILFTNDPELMYNDHYIKFMKSYENIPPIKKSTEMNYSSENTAICFEDHYLYIIHPINHLPNFTEKKTNMFIYTLDIIEMHYKQETNTIYFTHYQTHVFNWKPEDKNKPQIQDIFKKNKTLNRFIVVNGQIISPEGNHLLNIKGDTVNLSKSIVNIDSKINSSYKDIGLIASYKGNALFLKLNPLNKENMHRIYYDYYKLSSYEKENEFFNITNMVHNAYMTQSNTNRCDDVIEILFLGNLFNIKHKEMPDDNIINKQKGSSIQLLLQTLCDCIDYRQYMSYNSHQIEHCIKAPYIICLDYSTMLIFLDLFKQNYQNEALLTLISKLFLNQICQMAYNKTSAQILFNTTQKNEEYLHELLNYRNSTTHTRSKQMLSIILIKLLQLSKISSEIFNTILISILPELSLKHTIDYLISNQNIIYEFLSLMISTKGQCIQITSNKHLFDYFCTILTILLQAGKNSQNSVDLILLINKIMNILLTIFSLLLSSQNTNDQFNLLVYLLLTHIKLSTSTIVKEETSFSMSLLHFVLMIILMNFESLHNSIIFRNLSVLMEVIIELSALKPNILLEQSKRLDIVFDNTSSFEDISKSVLFKYPSSNLPPDYDIKDKIYIEAIFVRKEPLTEKTKILEIKSAKSDQIVSTIHIEGISSSNTYEIDVDLYSGVDICFYPNIRNTLLKIRISNYKFYSKEIDFLLQPSIELLNRMFKKLLFYSIDINKDEKLFDLLSPCLLSQGIINGLPKYIKNGDLDSFVRHIIDTSEYYSNYLSDIFTNIEQQKQEANDEKNSSQLRNNQLVELEKNREFNSILKQFNLQLNIIIKGDIPDRLVKYGFYIILNHEKILNEMLPENIEGSRKRLFSIWKECSNLRMVYKEIKDKLIQEDKNITQAFNEVFDKLNFIYGHHHENKGSKMHNYIALLKQDSVTKTTFPSYQIVKDHLANITQFIKHTQFSIDDITNWFGEIFSKLKFREIILKILIDLIKRLSDSEVVCNILSSFYCSFLSKWQEIPSIYMSLNNINRKAAENLTSTFHELLDILINKLISGKLSKFEQCIILNCLIWKIKKRNFSFFESKHLFNLLDDEDQLKNANYFLFLIPLTTDSKSMCLFENYSELRPIDNCYLGKLLTDIFSYYTHRIVKLEMKSSMDITANEGKLDELKLENMQSFTNLESYQNIIEIVVHVYEKQFKNILSVFKSLKHHPALTSLSNNEDDFMYPMDSKMIQYTLQRSIQLKLNNLLCSLNKNIIAQYRKGDSFFKYHNLWATIISQLKYSDYKNTRFIYSILEYYFLVRKDNLSTVYNEITSSNLPKSDYTNSLLFDYLFNMTTHKDLTCSLLQFWRKNINGEEVVLYVNDKIINELAFNMLDVFHCSFSNLRYLQKVIINTSLELEFKEVLSYKKPSQDMGLFIKNGYSLLKLEFQEERAYNTINNYKSKSKKEDEWVGGNELNSDLKENDRSDADSDKSDNSKNKNKGLNEICHLNAYNIPLKRNQTVILNGIEGLRANCLRVNENEILNIEEEHMIFDVNLIKKAIKYLSEIMLKKRTISINLMLNYLRILKCLIKASEQSNESKELIQRFIDANNADIQSLIHNLGDPVNFSVLPKDKLEVYFNTISSYLSEEEKNQIFPEQVDKSSKKREVCLGYVNSNNNMISLCCSNSIKNKINIPLMDRSRLNRINIQKNRLLEVLVMDMKEYEKMIGIYEQDEKKHDEEKRQHDEEQEKTKKESEIKLKEEGKEKIQLESNEIDSNSNQPNNKVTDRKEITCSLVNDSSNGILEAIASDKLIINVDNQNTSERAKQKELKKDLKDKKESSNELKKPQSVPFIRNTIIILMDEVIKHLGLNDKNEVCREKYIIEKPNNSSNIKVVKDKKKSKKDKKDDKTGKTNTSKDDQKSKAKEDEHNDEIELYNLCYIKKPSNEREKHNSSIDSSKINENNNSNENILEEESDFKEEEEEEEGNNNDEESGVKEEEVEVNDVDDFWVINEEIEFNDDVESDVKEEEAKIKEAHPEVKEEEVKVKEAQEEVKEEEAKIKEAQAEVKEEAQTEIKDEEENDNLFCNMFEEVSMLYEYKDVQPKSKKSSSGSDSIYKDFTNSSWLSFTKAIIKQYELTSCIFLIGSNYYNKIPKKFNSFSYDSHYLPTESLTSSSLHDFLQSHFSRKSNDEPRYSLIKEIQTKISNKKKSKLTNLYMQLSELGKEEKSKDKKDKEDKQSSLISIENRFITPVNTFKDLYQTFPTLATLQKKPSLLIIKSTGFSLIKYHLIHLQLVNSKLGDFGSFQFLFHSAYYYKECFNLGNIYDKMIKLLPDIMSSIPLKSFLENRDIVSLGYLSSNGVSNKIILDDVLIELIRMFGTQKENDKLSQILSFILRKGEIYLEQKYNEGTLVLFKLLIEIFHYIKNESTVSKFIHSIFIQSLQESVTKHSNSDKQYYYMKILEFLYKIMQLLINNKLIKQDDSEAYYNTVEFKNISMHFDIISNQFNSELLVNSLLVDDQEYKNQMKTTISLPAHIDSYAIKLNNFQSSVVFSQDNQQDSFIYLGQDYPSEKTVKYPSANIIKDSLLKDSLVIKHNMNGSLRTVLYNVKKKQMKKQNNSLRQGSEEHILFSNIYQLSENIIVGKDDVGKYYFCGKYNKSTKSKHHMFLHFDEMNLIAQHSQQITQIYLSLIITDQAVYYLKKDNHDSCPSWMEEYNSSMFKLPLKRENIFIGGHFYNERLLLWTKEGKLFGIGKNESSELMLNSDDEITQLTEIDKPADIHVLSALSLYDSILILALNTKTGVKNLYVNGYCFQMFESLKNDNNWFSEVTEYAREDIVKVIKHNGKLIILTTENLYTSFRNDEGDQLVKKQSYFKDKQYNVEDTWISGDYPIFKVKSKKTGYYSYFIVKSKNEEPKLVICLDSESEMEVNLDIRFFIIGKKKIIIANQFPPLFTPETYCYGEDSPQKGEMKFRLYKDGAESQKNDQHVALLYNSVNAKGIYVFDIIHNDSKQMLDEDKEITSNNSSVTKDLQMTESQWRITDESNHPSPLSNDIMNQLLQFTQSIEHISQITIFLPKTQNDISSSLVSPKFFSLPLLNMIDLSNINSNSIQDNIKDIIQSQRIKLIQRLTELNPSLISEFIKSKDFYSNHSKEINTSLSLYFKSKYSNNPKFHKLSSEVIIELLELVVKQFTCSIKFLMKYVNCLFDSFFSTLVLSNLSLIPLLEQTHIINSFFEPLIRNTTNKSIKIDRVLSSKNISQGLKDLNYSWSNYCQMCDQMKKCEAGYYIKKRENVLIEAEFAGEFGNNAKDNGRELIDLVFCDLSSHYLDLFIPTPNNVTKSGDDRDKYTINPSCLSMRCLELYTFLGKLLVYIFSSDNHVPFLLPSFIWKQILNIPLIPTDIEGIDVYSYNSIVKVLQLGTNEEKESLYDVLNFTCQLSNGKIIELIPNAENIKVNKSNADLFLSLYLRARYNECHEQIKAIRKGLLSGIPQNILKCLSWDKLEVMICGEATFELDLLKKNTIYDFPYNKEDKTIVNFWKFLEECTLEDKFLYLKFIWGRNRLPKSFETSDKHRISKMEATQEETNQKLPISHTCFFHLELPSYTTYDILKEKILYAMKNPIPNSNTQPDLTPHY